jgi:hypothetical protein
MSDTSKPETKSLIPGTPAAIMADCHDVMLPVLDRLQADIEKSAKDAGKNPTELVFTLWTTLGRVLTAHGANSASLMATFIATHPEIIAVAEHETDKTPSPFDGPSIFKTPTSDSIN